jgi:hypothetical protein
MRTKGIVLVVLFRKITPFNNIFSRIISLRLEEVYILSIKKTGFFIIAGLLLLLFSTPVNAEEVTKSDEFNEGSNYLTDFSPAYEEVLSEVENPGEEVKDLTNLTKQEANKLNEDDYIEYQMQTGNYVVESDGSIVVPDMRNSLDQIQPNCIACMQGRWVVKKLSGSSTVYGSWKSIASGWGPGSLSKTVSETRSNSYTGTLGASKSAVNTAVGFNITSSKTVSVTYSGEIKSGKQGFLQTRPTYKKYTVKQTYKKIGQSDTVKYVYPRKFWITDHRIGY